MTTNIFELVKEALPSRLDSMPSTLMLLAASFEPVLALSAPALSL